MNPQNRPAPETKLSAVPENDSNCTCHANLLQSERSNRLSQEIMPLPWQERPPRQLYKYLPPQRFHVLIDCQVRFSPRTAFEDDHELLPICRSFGTKDEMLAFSENLGWPLVFRELMLPLIAASPIHQATAQKVMLGNIKSVNEVGVFCLTETASSEQMWNEYADGGEGFAIAFDSTTPGFEQLKAKGLLGKVSYSDELPETFLGILKPPDVLKFFFLKRTKYSFEMEWRSIRKFEYLERGPGGVFFSRFDPTSVCEIIAGRNCTVEDRLRSVVENDARYHGVKLRSSPC